MPTRYLSFRDDFLDVAQLLFRLFAEHAVRPLQQQLATFLVGAHRMCVVAVRLDHLVVVDLADALLGFGRLFHRREERDEVVVLGFGLRQAMAAALAIPAVGDCQLRLGEILAVRVGIDQRLEREPRNIIPMLLEIADRLVKQHLVGLLRVVGDRVVVGAASATGGNDESDESESEITTLHGSHS